MQISSLISRAARHFGDAPCLSEGGRTVSFREFDASTNRLGNSLLAMGLEPGDRVGVMLPNSIDCLVVYYALAKCGLVRVGMNTRENIEDHRFKLGESGSRAVIHDTAEQLSGDVEYVIDREELGLMTEQGDSSVCAVDRDMDAPLRLGFTGGTTGQPKAVTLSTRGELSELAAFLTDLVPDIREGDSFLHAAPIAHASGAFFLPALCRGAHSLIMPKFDAEEFVRLAVDTQASLTFLVPTMLAMILEVPGINEANLNFRRIAYGASPISPRLLERAESRFGRVFAQSYGQAESPMVITCLKPEDHGRIGSCGRPFVIADVAVLDDDDRRLPPGETGEICVRGPQIMAGYWNRPDATAEAMRNGWLHTGDIGTMDEDGFFYLLDRKNDMLISGGFNVYPREVEDVLMSCDGVVEAAVVGLPDEKWGDRVHAVVSGRPDLDSGVVLTWAKSRLASYKCPKDVEIWQELPKSAANKILRRKVREIIVDRDSAAADEV
ncbi:MAG: AMP-binding protein [Halieaceae bacterium]|jgi:acyl-CoA synthetase (AMP-forming)/AMP-acid ligase II|uniref:class I adenylate-forming enzyme family protein n=1 Tax=Haliea alexandrii TaxID=2448162 RepID=UPI000F0B3B48|nr:AMP-binding protein [Haliea alexandrii]MCR9185878.1 AMP-binding protein [Halieaceae bacterium]